MSFRKPQLDIFHRVIAILLFYSKLMGGQFALPKFILTFQLSVYEKFVVRIRK